MTQTGKISCPSCSTETPVPDNDVDRLPRAGFVEQTTELYITATEAKKQRVECQQCPQNDQPPGIASWFCNKCKFICEKCAEIHKQLRTAFDGHEVVDINTLKDNFPKNMPRDNVPRKCKEHADELRYYCCKCEQAICRDCYTLGSHKEHQTRSVSESRTENFSTLEKQLELLSVDLISDGITKAEEAKTNIDLDVDDKRKIIEVLFEKLFEVLREKQSKVSKELTDIGESMKIALDTQLKELQTYRSEIERVSRVIQRCLESESDIDIVTCHKAMLHKADDLRKYCERNTTPATPEHIHMDVGLDHELQSSLNECLDRNLKVTGPQADASKSRLERSGFQRATIDEQISFTLKAVYENGQPCVTKQEFHAEVKTPNSSVSTPVEIKWLSKGTYLLQYTPKEKGDHVLHTFAGKRDVHVHGSPMKFFVRIPPSKIPVKDSKTRCLNFKQPYQIALTSKDELLVIESAQNGRVLKIDENGKDIEFREEVPNPDELDYPQGIATSADGSVYILYNTSNSRCACIVKYCQDGKVVAKFNDDKSQLKRPGRIKFKEGDNLLFVCDRGNNCFQVFDRDLNFMRNFAEGQLYADIAFGDDGVMYLSHKAGNSVYKFDKEGKEICQIGKQDLNSPRGLLYHSGFLYVADRNNKRIAVFDTTSTGDHRLVHCFTDETCRDAGSIVIDKKQNIYICDERGGRVFVF